ncbi:hypothetical protein SAMN05216499_15510 [Actinacidiphila paucisporea]|uniref:Uncharacterized protein n=1 Tax=Actinacidiphila paucisporea TaxID=310782 RepID=A0A1M7QZS1_9ACTN|nr:hypothetical protein SAMN05216499_15510 [Actinacidiphila paucisporea]
MPALSLYAGTMTLTGAATGGPHPADRFRTCLRAATSTATARTRASASAAYSSQPRILSAQALPSRALSSPSPSQCSLAEAGWIASCRPTADETAVTVKPRAASRGNSWSRAATVWERSPPASCISRIWPSVPRGVALATIWSTPGRCQSSLSSVVSTVRYPSRPPARTDAQSWSSRASLTEE